MLICITGQECRREKCDCAIITDTKEHALKIVDEKMEEYLEGCPECVDNVYKTFMLSFVPAW